MKCPDCGGPLSTPSMMNGCMTCQDCGHPWDQEWLCRFTAALAASRRALTMAEAKLNDLPFGGPKWCPTTHAAIKAARTSMDKAQGRRQR